MTVRIEMTGLGLVVCSIHTQQTAPVPAVAAGRWRS